MRGAAQISSARAAGHSSDHPTRHQLQGCPPGGCCSATATRPAASPQVRKHQRAHSTISTSAHNSHCFSPMKKSENTYRNRNMANKDHRLDFLRLYTVIRSFDTHGLHHITRTPAIPLYVILDSLPGCQREDGPPNNGYVKMLSSILNVFLTLHSKKGAILSVKQGGIVLYRTFIVAASQTPLTEPSAIIAAHPFASSVPSRVRHADSRQTSPLPTTEFPLHSTASNPVNHPLCS
jgi:hypothetical protein